MKLTSDPIKFGKYTKETNIYQSENTLRDRFSELGYEDAPDKLCGLLSKEVDELKVAIKNNDRVNAIEELGDVLFLTNNISSSLNINPSAARLSAVEKNNMRLDKAQELAIQRHQSELPDLSSKTKRELWKEAKKQLYPQKIQLLEKYLDIQA